MHMPERHVVERVVHRHVDVVDAAELYLVVGALGRHPARRDQLMRDGHVSPHGVYLTCSQRRAHGRRIVVADVRLGKMPAHVARLQKRDEPEIDRAMRVCELDALYGAVVHRRETHALVFQQALRIRDALGRIVVARHRQHANARFGHLGQEGVEQRDRFRARRGLVVDVARHQQRIHPVLARDGHDAVQDEPLVVDHRYAIHPLADVQVGHVQQLQGKPPIQARHPPPPL